MATSPTASFARLSDIDIRLLRLFDTVVQCSGFSAAEVDLNIGRSTISTHMAELEARLGVRLCRRGRAGFSLTGEGRLVHEACQTLFAALEDFRAEVGAMRNRLVGEINIGVIDNTVTDPNARLGETIARFRERGADVHITLQVISPTEIEHGVLEGRLHLGIGPVFHPLAGLGHETLYEERQCVYCGRGHPLFARAPDRVTEDELRAHDSVARGYIGGPQGPRDTVPLSAAATAYHMEGVAIMVLSGRFIGYLPSHYARQWVAEDKLRPLLPERTTSLTPFRLIIRKRGQRTLAVRSFLDELRMAHAPDKKKPPAGASRHAAH